MALGNVCVIFCIIIVVKGLDISAVYYKLLIDVNFKMDSLIGTSDEDEQLSKVTQNVSKVS